MNAKLKQDWIVYVVEDMLQVLLEIGRLVWLMKRDMEESGF